MRGLYHLLKMLKNLHLSLINISFEPRKVEISIKDKPGRNISRIYRIFLTLRAFLPSKSYHIGLRFITHFFISLDILIISLILSMSPWYFDPSLINEDQKSEIKARIANSSEILEEKSCILWTKSCSGTGYPQFSIGKKYESEFGPRQYNPGHVLYSIKHSVVLNTKGMDLSHRCHLKKCINIEHLSYEPKYVNYQRKTCVDEKKCFGHETYLACIL